MILFTNVRATARIKIVIFIHFIPCGMFQHTQCIPLQLNFHPVFKNLVNQAIWFYKKTANNLTEYRHVVFAPHLKGYTTTPNQTEDEKQRNWPEKSSFLIPNKEIQYPRSITKNIVRQLILTSLNPKKWQRKRELQPSKEKRGRQFMKHIKTHNIFKKLFLLVC